MRKKWEKGDPVSITDLLKITPLVNEALYLSEELKVDVKDLLWMVSEIVESQKEEIHPDEAAALLDLEPWDDAQDEFNDEETDGTDYLISVKVQGINRFPEVEFKAGINEKEDLGYFFEMILDMLDKLE